MMTLERRTSLKTSGARITSIKISTDMEIAMSSSAPR